MLYCALYTVLINFFWVDVVYTFDYASLWERLILDSSDHTISFHIFSVQSLWSFAHWRRCLCLNSKSVFLLNILTFNLASISLLFTVFDETMTLSFFSHISFRRGVSFWSLIDFLLHGLLSSHFEDNLGTSILWFISYWLIFFYFLMMSFTVLFGIFNCFVIVLDGSLSWYKAIIWLLLNSLVSFPLGLLWSAVF